MKTEVTKQETNRSLLEIYSKNLKFLIEKNDIKRILSDLKFMEFLISEQRRMLK